MFVRQKIGRQAGQIVEMPFAEAKANIDAGTADRLTDEEIQEAGHQAAASNAEVPPDQLMLGYRIEPAESGGFNLFDAGGVPVNKEGPFHNHIAARDAALKHARAMRGLPDLFDGAIGDSNSGTSEAGDDYEKMTVEQLKAVADERKLDSSGARSKKDWVHLLKHDDKVKAAIASGDFDALTVADLKVIAEERNIDVTGLTTKPEIVDAVKNGAKAKASA